MNIRPVRSGDRDTWLRMRHQLWPEEASEHREEVLAYFADQSTTLRTFVAEGEDAELIGFLEASIREYAEGCVSSPVAYAEGWWVDPTCRKQGVGRQLMAAMERWARDLGLIEVASDTEVVNQASQAAHAALGFVEVERVVLYRKTL